MTMPNDGSDCTGTLHQNSYMLLMANVGPSAPDMVPPTISMLSPADGATLPSGFDAEFMASDNRVVSKVELWANGGMILSIDRPPYKFTVPAGTLPAGTAKLKGVAYDLAGNTGETPEITVTVKALGQTPGDLGTSCNDSSECNGGGYCISDSGKSFCTRACSATSPCPSGFNCAQTPQFTSICSPQPKADDSGCSTTPAGSHDSSAFASLLALCALALVIARRKA
jgi:MYXO-CTERM domain-containing protein